MMLLAIDIGNTNIKMAIFHGKRIRSSWRLVTDKQKNLSQYIKALDKLFSPQRVNTLQRGEIIICSVVPGLTKIFKKALHSLFGKRPLILGKDILAPIKNLYKQPQQVGQDRLANAVAAVSKYGAPVIVVDFGTALTFDLVSEEGSYLGGVISPGLEVSLQGLIAHADLLPSIDLGKPRSLLGRETVASMHSGIVYGFSFLVEGILRELKKRLSRSAVVVATGGAASLMQNYCPSIGQIEPNLTLEGLRLSYEKGKKA